MTQADNAAAAAKAAGAVVQAYISAIIAGTDVDPNTVVVTDVDLTGATGTITLEIQNAETERGASEDRQLD